MTDWEYKQAVRKQRDIEKGSEVAKQVADLLNYFGNEDAVEGFVTQMTCFTHRTLQQSVMGLICKLLEAWAEMDSSGVYDLRNEATVKLATKLQEVCKDSYLPSI